jgi:heme A synthase
MKPAGWAATWVYFAIAPMCVFLPFAVPDDARPLPVVMAAGIPLCIIAILLGAIHRQHDLAAPAYRVTAMSFALSASLAVFPFALWIESIDAYRVLHVLYVIVTVLAALALAWLASRMWRLRSKLRIVLAVGVALVTLRFASSAYEAAYAPPASIEEFSESLAFS